MHIVSTGNGNVTPEPRPVLYLPLAAGKDSLEDDDINNLPVGEAIVSAPSGEPFRFKFNLYQ